MTSIGMMMVISPFFEFNSLTPVEFTSMRRSFGSTRIRRNLFFHFHRNLF
jgi:hypothetical protein